MDRERLAEVREAGLRLLARREHSAAELRQKLLLREYPDDLIQAALTSLAEEGLLSERRFAEAFVRSRRARGFGPARIRAELRQRGVDPELGEPALAAEPEDWQSLALAQYKKRFGGRPPRSLAEKAKHYRFLIQRGFTPEQVRKVLEQS